MRITKVQIVHWRNLRDVELNVLPESRVVCLVGENGSGKSTVLELLSAAAHHLGISSGVEIPRGSPLAERHRFAVTALVPDEIAVKARTDLQGHLGVDGWQGELRFASQRDEHGNAETHVRAVGIEDPSVASHVGAHTVGLMRGRPGTHHLYLDADRSYPPMQIQPHQYGEIYGQDWSSADWTRQWAYRPTKTLYEEWNKYFIGTEERVAIEHLAAVRRAKRSSSNAPDFIDPFDGYRESVNTVLPHLIFVGVQATGVQRTIVFDSADLEIPFSKLSGGEREIAFLIGQIERFGLRTGLLMIDEPELHLNPDLLRTWVAFLRDTVLEGQVWMATHSLEAVEVAGPEASFVFEKAATDRLTRTVTSLAGRPVVSALSAAIGAPAFSISKLRFVFVEGDRQSRERERFFDLCGDPAVNRFIEGGSCHEVLRRLGHVRELASETGEQLRIGGVIDRDFRSDEEARSLASTANVYVLGCHEVENLFVHPAALEVLRTRAALAEPVADLLRRASDTFAGLWVAQFADSLLPELRSTPKASMAALSSLTWDQLCTDVSRHVVGSAAHFPAEAEKEQWSRALEQAVAAYESARSSDELWARCLGKQVHGRVSAQLGFANASTIQRHVLRVWQEGDAPEPAELSDLRQYISNLTA